MLQFYYDGITDIKTGRITVYLVKREINADVWKAVPVMMREALLC